MTIIFIGCNIIGILGAYKENYVFTLTYAGMKILNFIFGIPIALYIHTYFYLLGSSFLIFILAYNFSSDLSKAARLRPVLPQTMVSRTPQTIATQTSIYSLQYNSNQFEGLPEPPPPYSE